MSKDRKRTAFAVVAVSLLAFMAGGLAAVVVMFLMSSGAPAGQSAGAGGPAAGGMPPGKVRLGQVEQDQTQRRVRVLGRLREIRRATVAAEISGRVLKAPIEEGDRVTGDESVLAEIDDIWIKVAVKEAEAQLQEAQASLEQAELDLSLLEDLQQARSAKPREVEDQRKLVEQRAALVQAAQARLERAQAELERTKITAPFDGVVVRKLAEQGQWVSPGTAIAEVISSGQMDARLDVPEYMVNTIEVGDKLDVIVDPTDGNVAGEVVAVNPAGDNAARTFPVDVRVPDQNGQLKVGMSVRSFIPVGEAEQTLIVPRDAVLTRQGKSEVWVAMPSDQPDQMPVAVPLPVHVRFGVDADHFAVRPLPMPDGKKLAPGMPVVVEGAESLFPMQPLMVQDDQGNAVQATEQPSQN